MDVARSVVNTNDVILNRSCRDIRVGASYVNGLHKTGTRNSWTLNQLVNSGSVGLKKQDVISRNEMRMMRRRNFGSKKKFRTIKEIMNGSYWVS
uniref:Uncharacterized protein n=1 Tax=Cucumis melo TaxID=3656 RepID=A0A9I9E9D9_CUCME